MPISAKTVRVAGTGADDVYFRFDGDAPFSNGAPVYWRAYLENVTYRTSDATIWNCGRHIDFGIFVDALKSMGSDACADLPSTPATATAPPAPETSEPAYATSAPAASAPAANATTITSCAAAAAPELAADPSANKTAIGFRTNREGDWLAVFVVKPTVERGVIVRKEIFSIVATRITESEYANAGARPASDAPRDSYPSMFFGELPRYYDDLLEASDYCRKMEDAIRATVTEFPDELLQTARSKGLPSQAERRSGNIESLESTERKMGVLTLK